MKRLDTPTSGRHCSFYARGNLLLTGEYFVLDGAKSLAMPTSFGQSLSVRHTSSDHPTLFWKSLDHQGRVWLEVQFELQHFHIPNGTQPDKKQYLLQKVLREARRHNSDFLKEKLNIYAETRTNFPLNWGLGSSATLIAIVAKWAFISAHDLFFNVFEGSGYDVACAQSQSPILYQRCSSHTKWNTLPFSPPFKQNLYFVYLGRKIDTRKAIVHYRSKRPFSTSVMSLVSSLTESLLKTKSLEDFQWLLEEHENIVAKNLQLPRVKNFHFCDFPGTIKSLGAWGGDFVLAASSKLDYSGVTHYFTNKGITVCLPYNKMISPEDKK